jgi:hypothetical protein
MQVVNQESSELVGITQLNSLKAKETLLHSFVLLLRKINGKLLYLQLHRKALGITTE